MNNLNNLNLLSVGITVASIAVLGFAIYFNNKKSTTNQLYLVFAITTVIWSISNYLNSQFITPDVVLWALRAHLFISTWYSFCLLALFYVFPESEKKLPNIYKLVFIPLTGFISLFTLTNYVFSGIEVIAPIGQVSKAIQQPGIFVFALTSFSFVFGGIFLLYTKMARANGLLRKQYQLVLLGTLITFALIISFNLIFPVVFGILTLAPLGALSIFPLVVFTAYAIFKHGLLNIKIVATEILTFVLAVVTFSEVIFAINLGQVLFRSSVFMLVMIFGILLIRSVRREVDQREKIEKLAGELAVANSKLRELDKQKTEFLSIASHQLRAPLTAIKGYSSLILENSFGDVSEKVRGAVNVIFISSQKLVTVIEDFLNITRIELGKMKYEMSSVDMKQMTETAVRELHNQIEAKGLKLDFDAAGGVDYKITADAGKVAQVITNLIDNASKYTREGSIHITLSRPGGASGKVRLAITDTGIGLNADAATHLFEKFTRAADASHVNIIGTGLGLYVAKQIVEAHGGKIWAESPGPGKGSTFCVEL